MPFYGSVESYFAEMVITDGMVGKMFHRPGTQNTTWTWRFYTEYNKIIIIIISLIM